jgi:alkane 1-monooxygenase
MSVTLMGTASDGSQIRYVDKKRWLYSLSLFFPAVPAISAALYFTPIGVWATLFPALWLFGIVPLIDLVIGEDPHNPPEQLVDQLATDMHYKWLVRSAVVVVWISFIATVALVGTQSLPWWSWLILVFGVGMTSGSGLAFGHELGHKQDPTDRLFALFNNAVVGYAHIRYEHNIGHHVWVSTPEDPASARMGESLPRFVMREIPGALKSGYVNEAKRLQRRGKSFWSLDNEILQSTAITLTAALVLAFAFGWQVLPFILLHHAFGWYLLSHANYVEHYGLLRQKQDQPYIFQPDDPSPAAAFGPSCAPHAALSGAPRSSEPAKPAAGLSGNVPARQHAASLVQGHGPAGHGMGGGRSDEGQRRALCAKAA